jgi:hypothetical protein
LYILAAAEGAADAAVDAAADAAVEAAALGALDEPDVEQAAATTAIAARLINNLVRMDPLITGSPPCCERRADLVASTNGSPPNPGSQSIRSIGLTSCT